MVTGSARSRSIAFAVMAVIFLAGGMAGFAVKSVLAAEEKPAPEAQPRPERAERRERRSIFDDLDLTPEQRTRIDSIFAENRREMDAFWKEHRPTMQAIVDSTRAEIDRTLTPEQRQKMEEFREQRRKEYGGRERGGRPDSFGPHPPRGDSVAPPRDSSRGGDAPEAASPDDPDHAVRGRAVPAPAPRERPLPTPDIEPRPVLAGDRTTIRHVDLKYS